MDLDRTVTKKNQRVLNAFSSPDKRPVFSVKTGAGILATSLLAGVSLNPAFAALDPRGTIGDITGQIILKQGSKSRVVTIPTDVSEGDVVITVEKATATLTQDGCKIELQPNSLYTIRPFSSCKAARNNVLAMDSSFMPDPVTLTPARPSQKQVRDANKDVGRLFDEPGVLTPRGSWVINPSFGYSHSTATNVSIEGLSVLPALAVGLIEVSETQRNTVTGSVGFTYGLTQRVEISAKVPYTWREVTSRARDVGTGDSADGVSGTDGSGIGDVELSARFQLHKVKPNKPYFIGSLRVKSRTGLDSFEVAREQVINQDNNEVIGETLLEQPTGSGFWSIQPSISVIMPTEPSVLFGSVNYLVNLERDIGGTTGVVDPGDSLGFNFGVGFSINPRTSFTLGYDHSLVFKTKTENSGIEAVFDEITIGNVLFGISHVFESGRPLNVNIALGATDQSNDISLSFKTSFRL